MAKLELNDLLTLENQTSAINTINANNAAIETALENTLSRDGTSPNSMGADLDMNSNRIYNLPAPGSATEPVRLVDITGEEALEIFSDPILEDIASLDPVDGNIMVGNGVTWVAESGATARTSLGLGTGDSPTFTGITVGPITATNITADVVTVDDEAYDSTGWNGDLSVPTKNAVRDVLESLTPGPGGFIPFNYEDTEFDIDTDHSFYFGDYECLGAIKFQVTNTEDQSDFDGGGFRDVLAVFHYDDDTTDYEALSDQKVSYGIRSYVTPSTAGRLLTNPQYKDYTAGAFEAIGYIMWPDRGVSGVTCSAIQYGEGIASNEFASSNPSDAPSQSFSMASVQAIISSKKAASDSTHKARGVLISNIGKSITAGLEAMSVGTGGDNGQFEYWLKGDQATVNTAAIFMPASSTGNLGTRIVYDTGDFTEFDRAANTFVWAMGGSGELGLSIGALYPIVSDGLALGGTGSLWSDLWLASGAVINFDTGDVTITHAANTLAFAGGTTYNFDDQISIGDSAFNIDLAAGLATITFDSNDQLYYERSTNSFNFVIAGSGELFLNVNTLTPIVHNGLGLGTPTTSWADLFLATGGVINWENGDVTLTHSSNALTLDGGSLILNEAGGDFDMRIEGDTEANLFYTDASTDRVGIGTATPQFRLHVVVPSGAGYIAALDAIGIQSIIGPNGSDKVVVGSSSAHPVAIFVSNSEKARFTTTSAVFNEDAADYDFRIEGDTEANLFFADASTDRIGIGTSTPASTLDVRGNVLAPNLQQQVRITGVNFNSANTDNAVTVVLPNGFSRFRIGGIVISGASASLTTSTFGVFTSTGGGGTAVIASGTANTVSTASESTTNNMQFVTPANVNTASYNNTTLYFRVQNPQGSAATGNVTIFYQPVS